MTERDEMIAQEKEQMAKWAADLEAKWKREKLQQAFADVINVLCAALALAIVGGLFYAITSIVLSLSTIAHAVSDKAICPVVSQVADGKTDNFDYVLAPKASDTVSGGNR